MAERQRTLQAASNKAYLPSNGKDAVTPTDEQIAIIEKRRTTSGNLLIKSFAGTGKTTTLELLRGAIKAEPVLYLCFNKRVAEEAEERFTSSTVVRTFNSFGHRTWAKTNSTKLILNKQKSADTLRELISNAPKAAQSTLWDCFWDVIAGVAMAKAIGYVPEGKYPSVKRLATREALHARLDEPPDELVAELIDEILFKSIQQAYKGYIDYNDQIYMPALFGSTKTYFEHVLVDETQDLNPVNHAILDQFLRGRLDAVGDDCQSIYGFRGAMQGGMATLKEKFKMTECELTVSFRCPQAIVEAARWRVPQFKWIKPGGTYEILPWLDANTIPDDAAFICRNNAPLFKLALQLLIAKRSVTVIGSDIGPKVVGIMKKLGDSETKRESLLLAIEDWRMEKLAKQSTTANDIAECMKVFASYGETLGQAILYAQHLFEQRGRIRLITGHKAKGLEWNTVYHLDPWLIGTDEQELNLRYVITTRAKERLFEINSQNIKWS